MYCVNDKYFAEFYRNMIGGDTDRYDAEYGCEFYFNEIGIGPT